MTERVRAPLKTISNQEDNTMPARTGYEHLPDFWNAYLASSVGNHLHGNQTEDQLAHDYERYLGSPAVDRTLRNLLPGPVGKRKKVKHQLPR